MPACDPAPGAVSVAETQPTGGDEQDRPAPAGEAGMTIDFARESSPAASAQSGTSSNLLEPPRGGDEVGWLAHYRVLRPIGVGGMGLVYLAEDTQLGRQVALKVIRPELAASPDAASRFMREARAAAAIKHDNVVTIYQVGESHGVSYLAMEYLQGVSLQRWLDRGKKPSIDLILRIGREVASGLAAAHKLGLVHRDIKPANIWLEAPNGRAKILDFGQARAQREDVQITREGAIVGTPSFMSPEQAAGEPAYAPSDLFSLGCVLYRLCCGKLPFEGNTIISVLNALANHNPSPPIELDPEIPEDLNALVVSLLAKSPSARPPSAQAVYETIRGLERQLVLKRQTLVLDTSSGTGTMVSAPLPRLPGAGRATVETPPANPRRWLTIIAAGSLVPVALGLGYLLIPSGRRPAADRTQAVPADKAADPAPEAPAAVAKVEPEKPAPQPEPGPKNAVAATSETKAVSETKTVDVPSVPTPAPSTPTPSGEIARAEPPAPPLTPEELWGVFNDPDGDCRFLLDTQSKTATLEVPGTAHALSVELGLLNAPRTLRPVQGDFESRVRAGGTEQVTGRPTVKTYSAYHGVGMLLWQDEKNYIRLEIATDIQRGKQRPYANFEYREAGKLVSSRGQAADPGPAMLRLDRSGTDFTASFSADGIRWVYFPVLKTTLADKLQIGLVAINTASKPLSARYEDFQVAPRPKPARETAP